MEKDKTLPKCSKCGQEGECYYSVIPGGDTDGGSDITKFFFFCPRCHHSNQDTKTGDWGHRCSFCNQTIDKHKWLPKELEGEFSKDN